MRRTLGMAVLVISLVSAGCLGVSGFFDQSETEATEERVVLPNRLQVQALLENHTATVIAINETSNETAVNQTYHIVSGDHLNLHRELNEGTAYRVWVSVPEGNEMHFRINETETKIVRIEADGSIHRNTVDES